MDNKINLLIDTTINLFIINIWNNFHDNAYTIIQPTTLLQNMSITKKRKSHVLLNLLQDKGHYKKSFEWKQISR